MPLYVPPEDPTPSHDTVLGLIMNSLETPLDILARPSYALGEAYGSATHGGSAIKGAWRGLTKGSRGALYGTLGQQFAPESLLGQIGIDMLTDPLTLLPPLRLTRAALRGLEATEVGARALKGISTAVHESEALQKLSRFVMPMEARVGFWGKLPGRMVTTKARIADEAFRHEAGRWNRDLVQTINALGLGGKENAERRTMAAIAAMTPGAPLKDEAAKKLSIWLRGALDTVGNKADQHGLLYEFLPNYYPQYLKPEEIAKLNKAPSTAPDALAKMLGVSREEAESIWKYQSGRPTKAGHLELPRQVKFPHQALLLDPLEVMPRYFTEATRRIAYVREFGPVVEKGNKLPKLDRLLERAMKAGLDPNDAAEIRQAIASPFFPEARGITTNLAQRLMGYMVVTKMGVTSTLSNLSQSANTGIVDGGANFLRGLFRAATDPTIRSRHVIAYHQHLREVMENLMGSASNAGVAAKYLKWTGFQTAESINRILAASSGVVTAERLAKEAMDLTGIVEKAGKRAKILQQLRRRGVNSENLRYFTKYQKFSEKAEEAIGLRAARRTQFATSWLDLPPAWRSPEGRLMTQYKQFVLQQSRFLTREIMRPTALWLAGKEGGSLTPLMKASVAYGLTGQTVAWLRQKLRGDPKDRRIKSKDPIVKLMREASYVGAFGMASDIVENAMRGDLASWILGPTLDEGLDATATLVKWASDPEVPDADEIANELYKRTARGALPFLGPYLKKRAQ